MSTQQIKVPCLNCKELFIPPRPWSKFCCEKCRNCYNNDKRDKEKNNPLKCPHCKTDDRTMFEELYEDHYLCGVCAKEFNYEQLQDSSRKGNGGVELPKS